MKMFHVNVWLQANVAKCEMFISRGEHLVFGYQSWFLCEVGVQSLGSSYAVELAVWIVLSIWVSGLVSFPCEVGVRAIRIPPCS